MEIDLTHSTSSFRGKSVGLFAGARILALRAHVCECERDDVSHVCLGLFVLIYFLGCILAAVCGIVCGQKFLEWRRDR
jgi:hypothetical protein